MEEAAAPQRIFVGAAVLFPLPARRFRPLRWEMNCVHYIT